MCYVFKCVFFLIALFLMYFLTLKLNFLYAARFRAKKTTFLLASEFFWVFAIYLIDFNQFGFCFFYFKRFS